LHQDINMYVKSIGIFLQIAQKNEYLSMIII